MPTRVSLLPRREVEFVGTPEDDLFNKKEPLDD
jgi:hypothetical protein